MSTLDEAIKWRKMGISTIPAGHKSKLPDISWRRWQDEIPPLGILKRWFSKEDKNIAVVCGGKSRLVVLDFDEIKSYYDWKALAVNQKGIVSRIAHNGYKVKTSRGMHIYLFSEDIPETTKVQTAHIDIRGQGSFVIAPPSIHPTGSLYRIWDDGPIYRVPNVMSVIPEELQDKKIPITISDTEVISELDKYHDYVYMGIIQDIKRNFPMLRLANRYTQMDRTSADGRWYIGRCPHPAHNDVHPSFRVDSVKNKAKCLSSRCVLNSSMDIIDLYAILSNTNIRQSIVELGLELGFLI